MTGTLDNQIHDSLRSRPAVREKRIDLLAKDFKLNPYPTYARLRSETPAAIVTLPDGREGWLFTRYEDVAAILGDHEKFSNRAMLSQLTEVPELSSRAQDVMSLFALIMSSVDPPDHTRLRNLVQKAFTPSFVERLRPTVHSLTDELLDAVDERVRKTGERKMDLIADYAFPLPAAVIMKFLGVPIDDMQNIRRLLEPLMRFDRSPESAEALGPEIAKFIDYIRALLEIKRQNPNDDLLSRLVHEEDGQKLPALELVSLTFQLIFAGHSTTSHLIGNGALALLMHPDQFEKLKAVPSLIQSAVEELLRFDAPQQMRARLAVDDVKVGDVTVRRGQVVLAAIGSANRDPRVFEAADDLNITRKDNRHVAFGRGIHSCFGVPLARLECEVAITILIRRMPRLSLAVAPEQLTWLPNGLHQRGLATLPVVF